MVQAEFEHQILLDSEDPIGDILTSFCVDCKDNWVEIEFSQESFHSIYLGPKSHSTPSTWARSDFVTFLTI